MTLTLLAAGCLALAAVPTMVFFRNLGVFLPAPRLPADAADLAWPSVSVLIPARNEERSIVATLEAVLASTQVSFEVVVLDDHSQDATAALVRSVAERDGRVRWEQAPPLPPGWCGKQHACAALAQRARHDVFVFLDADVRLAPDALARMTRLLEESRADLLSGFPRQETGTWAEKLLIPLMHFLLLGFLSLRRMRASRHPAYGAGCGQLFMTRRAAYERSGGHAAICASLHDGLKLPRRYRAAGMTSDVFDAADLASCRMYRSSGETFHGLAKNATEGMANATLLAPATLLLVGGQVAPPALFLAAILLGQPIAATIAGLASIISWLPRWVCVWRFHQSALGAALHPLAIVLFIAIQWHAFARSLLGRPSQWKDRVYLADPTPKGAYPNRPLSSR